MTRLLILLLTLLWATPSWAAFGVTFTDAGTTTVWDGTTVGTVTVSAAAGDTICVWGDVQGSNRTLTITDNKSGGSNTYTLMATREILNAVELWINCTVTAGTVTEITGTLRSAIAPHSHLVAWVITGARSALSAPNAATSDTTGTSHATGTVTITDATALLIGGSVHAGTGAITLDALYTSRYSDTGLVIGDDTVSGNQGMTNTTGSNRATANALVEIRPAATAGDETFGFRKRLEVNQ